MMPDMDCPICQIVMNVDHNGVDNDPITQMSMRCPIDASHYTYELNDGKHDLRINGVRWRWNGSETFLETKNRIAAMTIVATAAGALPKPN